MANIGFIGLGIMGKPMANHLIRGGHQLFLHSRSGVPESLIEQGGRACSSPKEVAQHADIIVLMLPDTPDVEKSIFRGFKELKSNETTFWLYRFSFSLFSNSLKIILFYF